MLTSWFQGTLARLAPIVDLEQQTLRRRPNFYWLQLVHLAEPYIGFHR